MMSRLPSIKARFWDFWGLTAAGKTTTLRLIGGTITATSGRVTVAGFDMARQNTAAARQIGYLPERPPLYDGLDVSSYLKFVAKAKGIPRRGQVAELERVIVACHLEAVHQYEIFKLSKGYRQRVGLAQALLGEPEVLLLDEPTIGLDPAQIQETRDVIQAFGAAHTVILSTHILPEVTQICHRVAILHHGRLLAIDTPLGLRQAVAQTHAVTLRVTAPAEALKTELLSLDGIDAVQIEPIKVDSSEEILDVVCNVGSKEGIEAAIARAVASRWALHRLQRREASLENVFLHYVSQTPAGEGPA